MVFEEEALAQCRNFRHQQPLTVASMMSQGPALLNVHTPSSSFTIIHCITQDSLDSLYDKLRKKVHSMHSRSRVGPGWLKYEFNDTIWNLDDDSDYTIFVWRQKQQNPPENDPLGMAASISSIASNIACTPTLHLHDPSQPLPQAPEYTNPSYYAFKPPRHPTGRSTPSQHSVSTRRKSKKAKGNGSIYPGVIGEGDAVPKHKHEFNKFHSENGVRTVMGSIGPVQNVRMLLRSGYRHVYISRKFALEHGFIPADAAPGHYGYGGLVNLGTWPITLTPSTSQPNTPASSNLNGPINNTATRKKSKDLKGPKLTPMTVYLSEEPHFDVVLGRSFIEKRQIRTTATDMTDVVCMDTGEKIECELVILKDGRGEIVTVT
ncbi:hypothetical protein E1B28_008977 [Marasmius oreades]|uniref:Uncharacterized protein n=1 Tax=Marasmius oreades TaxID=181124 RepID=A0A9P7S049_9AGAR|nr:uncharacterized protein E1B28_008977 [Marasmius oreades]KAG7092635.1 hypothetical protein E1B28_008977 [Marasmius oreades]